MPNKFTNHNQEVVLLSTKPFATPGGEGTIYEVLNTNGKELVAKIYHTMDLAGSRQEKIEFMRLNNPTIASSEAIKNSIIWVEELLYKDGVFVGFTMPKVIDAISLKALTLARNPSKSHGSQWEKFNHEIEGAHQKRLIVAYNLSQAIQVIHESGNYVLVDMKPENIFVREDASIAIIDLDSIQIQAKTEGEFKLQFPANVFTEEYAPPEKLIGLINHKEGRVSKDWDHFSLAVIIYELIFGIHPYQASHQDFNTRPELIKEGFFVHGEKREELHKVPPIHNNFQEVSDNIQNQFLHTFSGGHLHPSLRVNPIQWSSVLMEALQEEDVSNKVFTLLPAQISKPKPDLKAKRNYKGPNANQNRAAGKVIPIHSKSYFYSSSPLNPTTMVFLVFAGLMLLFVLRITNDLEPYILYPFLAIYFIPIFLSLVKRRLSTFVVLPYLFFGVLLFSGQLRAPNSGDSVIWLNFNSDKDYIGKTFDYVIEKEGKPLSKEVYSHIEIWHYEEIEVKFVDGKVETYFSESNQYIRRF